MANITSRCRRCHSCSSPGLVLVILLPGRSGPVLYFCGPICRVTLPWRKLWAHCRATIWSRAVPIIVLIFFFLRNQEEPEAPTAIELNKQRYKVQLQRTKDKRQQKTDQGTEKERENPENYRLEMIHDSKWGVNLDFVLCSRRRASIVTSFTVIHHGILVSENDIIPYHPNSPAEKDENIKSKLHLY